MEETLTQIVADLEEEQRALSERLAFIQRCAQRFPSLRPSARDKQNRYRLIADEVTQEATAFRIQRSCGCCDDASLYIEPYLPFGEKAVYSPVSIYIGTGTYLAVDPEELGEKLRQEHYAPVLVDKVVAHLKTLEAEYEEDYAETVDGL